MLLITHDNRFYFDNVLATVLLKEVFESGIIIRTSNSKIFKIGDIIYDVGNNHDPYKGHFNFRISNFKKKFNKNFNVNMSCAGLIYQYYGIKILKKHGILTSDPYIEFYYNKIYENYVLLADSLPWGHVLRTKIPSRLISDTVESFYTALGENPPKHEVDIVYNNAVSYVKNDFIRFLLEFKHLYIFRCMNMKKLVYEATCDVICTQKDCVEDAIPIFERECRKNIKFLIKIEEGIIHVISIPVSEISNMIKIPICEDWKKDYDLFKKLKNSEFIYINKTRTHAIVKNLKIAKKICEISIFKFDQKYI